MPLNELLIRTARLDLIAATLQHIEAELASPGALGPLLGVSIPPDWPPGEYDRNALKFFHSQLQAGGAAHTGWYSWYAMTRNSHGWRATLVAGAGYFGPPKDGTVEIGYSVIPAARGQGYATEIVAALVRRAFETLSVQQVLAHTSDANTASTRVLLRCGFERVGPGPEPDAVRYSLSRTPRVPERVAPGPPA